MKSIFIGMSVFEESTLSMIPLWCSQGGLGTLNQNNFWDKIIGTQPCWENREKLHNYTWIPRSWLKIILQTLQNKNKIESAAAKLRAVAEGCGKPSLSFYSFSTGPKHTQYVPLFGASLFGSWYMAPVQGSLPLRETIFWCQKWTKHLARNKIIGTLPASWIGPSRGSDTSISKITSYRYPTYSSLAEATQVGNFRYPSSFYFGKKRTK